MKFPKALSRLTFSSLILILCSCTQHINPKSVGTDRPLDSSSEFLTFPNESVSVIQCPSIPVAPTCSLSSAPAEGQSLWIFGDLLVGDEVYKNGGLEIGSDGKISNIGCITVPSEASVLSCPGQVVSPGLINPHDHLSYNQNSPGGQNNNGGASNPNYSLCNDPHEAYENPACEGYRYDRRNEWRKGLDGKPAIVAPWGGTDQSKAWNELRHVMAGATTVAGSGGQIGLVRNPDVLSLMEGLVTPNDIYVDYETFPLGDTTDVTGLDYGDCQYPKVVDADVLDNLIFLPHVAEGINEYASNELYCLTGSGDGSVDLRAPNSTFIHTVAAIPPNAQTLKDADMTMVWSPRSNLSLYGNTAQVTLYDTMGVRIALSSDWTPSGSVNMQRELSCAADFNDTYLNGYFSRQDLWKMVTVNAARSLGIDDQVGSLAIGHWADIAIYNAAGQGYTSYYDPVINGNVEYTSIVLRGGAPLFGDQDLVQALQPDCEAMPSNVCSVAKAVCVAETGYSLSDIYAANTNSYPLYFCGAPDDEPTCVPARYREYSGKPSSDDQDGDNISNTQDNCPTIFNPVRPMDNGIQADYNSNGIGDVCDPYPL